MQFDFSRLFGLKKSNEIEAVVPDLETALEAAKLRLADIKSGLTSAPFESSADELKALRQRIRETEDEIETLEGVLGEAVKRRDAAVAAEAEDQWRASMEASRKDREELRAAYALFDKTVAKLTATIDDISTLTRKIAVTNSQATEAGFASLAVRVPAVPGEITKPFLEARPQALTMLLAASRTAWFQVMDEGGKL